MRAEWLSARPSCRKVAPNLPQSSRQTISRRISGARTGRSRGASRSSNNRKRGSLEICVEVRHGQRRDGGGSNERLALFDEKFGDHRWIDSEAESQVGPVRRRLGIRAVTGTSIEANSPWPAR